MASTDREQAPLSDAEQQAREWEQSFRRAERLLEQAQETMRRRHRSPEQPVYSARSSGERNNDTQSV